MSSAPTPGGAPSSMPPRVDQLKGFRIGVTSDRRSEDLIAALERRGAQVFHAPALKIAPNDQDGPLVHETRALIGARPEVVLVTTGYGMRRWFEVADAAGLGAELTAVLDQAVILARGPKALGSVRAAGLDDALMSDQDTTASLVDKVADLGLHGRRVAIQLHGYTDEVQLRRLAEMSSSVLRVTPYRWVKPARQDRLAKLIEAACHGQLDAITFTSAPGADATLAAAEAMGLGTAFVDALQCDVVAVAVGPVTAGPLADAGIRVIYPDRHRLGALIRLVCEHLDQHRVERFVNGANVIELRGRALTINGERILLGPNALALFKALAAADGVIARSALLQVLPDEPDDHALEVAVSRLRRALGIDGLISTVVKRGYRLNAERVGGLD
jgi:uroporphyrinogen-III synthase